MGSDAGFFGSPGRDPLAMGGAYRSFSLQANTLVPYGAGHSESASLRTTNVLANGAEREIRDAEAADRADNVRSSSLELGPMADGSAAGVDNRPPQLERRRSSEHDIFRDSGGHVGLVATGMLQYPTWDRPLPTGRKDLHDRHPLPVVLVPLIAPRSRDVAVESMNCANETGVFRWRHVSYT